jgi:diguanylate cyclase (GGDEF)-like protein
MHKILVIEDEAHIREIILEILEAEDFAVIEANNGQVGVTLAAQELPDLIICDVMMPALDGYGTIAHLRNDPTTQHIPVIFLTAKATKGDMRQGMNLGADDYLTKPFTRDELMDAVTARLARVAQQNQKLAEVSQKLEQLEQFDSLTGLPNQLVLGDYFQEALQQAQANSNNQQTNNQQTLISFLLLGLDRFAQVNDTIGYENGDLILKELAQRLTDFIQTVQGVGVVRLPGDEFAAILAPVSREEQALGIAENLLTKVAQPYNVNRKMIPVTGTIGISFYPQANNLDTLRQQASMAMSEAKKEGGNRCKIYVRPLFGADTAKDLQTAGYFQTAWQRKMLKVFYQPRIDIRSRKIVGAEAVVYWQDPTGTVVSPRNIATLADKTGLRLAIAEWLLPIACQQAKQWQQARKKLRMAVNVPPQLFMSPSLLEVISQQIEAVSLDPSYLELEISADTIASQTNLNLMASKLLGLQRLGTHVTITDFGLVHSSGTFGDLGLLALNNLKLDSRLVSNLSQNEPAIAALIQIARGRKLKAIASGVETEAQIKTLHKYKCDEIQQNISLAPTELLKFI